MKANPKRNWEIEIKLPLSNVEDGRSRLRAAGFRVSKRRIFEENVVYDTLGLKLRKAQALIRVRQAGQSCKITFKGPPAPSDLKSREELETAVDSAAIMGAILGRLGYRPVFRYQKYRTELRRGKSGGTATLDETPIGAYLELEGEPEWIRRTARKLGFSSPDYITASYGRLYLDWCRAHRVPPGNMVF